MGEVSLFAAVSHPESPADDETLLQRFVADRDERQFARLIERHGGLVMSVCRGVLGHRHDAEDAFQATFLVLARKASTLRSRASLAAWLHTTAFRIAQRTRAARARRRMLPLELEPMIADEPTTALADDHRRSVLDEELHRLPQRYRLPLFLCCIEGRSRDEAAAQLGWSLASLKGRLERGRQQLRRRLLLRGVSLSVALAAAAAVQQATQASVGPGLIAATAQGALHFAGGQIAAGYVSAHAIHLAKGGSTSMSVNLAVSSFIAVTLAATLGVGGWSAGVNEQNEPTASASTTVTIDAAWRAAEPTSVAAAEVALADETPDQPAAEQPAQPEVKPDGEKTKEAKPFRRRPEMTGQFKAYDEAQHTLFYITRGDDGEKEHTFDVQPEAEIVVDGQPGKLTDVAEGCVMRLWFNNREKGRVTIIDAEGTPIGGRNGRPILSVDAKNRTITVKMDERPADVEVFQLSPDARLLIDREEAKLEDLLTSGERSRIITSAKDLKTIVLIEQSTGRRGEK